ncbi:hypothetical protein A3Q56_05149 [Intoshia linei]|uniref:Uncharacterized protein n=1 Tax=Intoshia linei TaxID=1819745 RepID=A0A177B0H2_9BILA|nr:hypothetical protein A3Q56_05149 [Intoshia linei]
MHERLRTLSEIDEWNELLPYILMSTRYTISKKIGVFSAEIVLGYDINRDNANRLSLKEAITSHKKIHNSRVKRNYDSHVQKSKFHTKFKPLLPHKK